MNLTLYFCVGLVMYHERDISHFILCFPAARAPVPSVVSLSPVLACQATGGASELPFRPSSFTLWRTTGKHNGEIQREMQNVTFMKHVRSCAQNHAENVPLVSLRLLQWNPNTMKKMKVCEKWNPSIHSVHICFQNSQWPPKKSKTYPKNIEKTSKRHPKTSKDIQRIARFFRSNVMVLIFWWRHGPSTPVFLML